MFPRLKLRWGSAINKKPNVSYNSLDFHRMIKRMLGVEYRWFIRSTPLVESPFRPCMIPSEPSRIFASNNEIPLYHRASCPPAFYFHPFSAYLEGFVRVGKNSWEILLTIQLVFSRAPTRLLAIAFLRGHLHVVSNDLHQYVPWDIDGSQQTMLTDVLSNSDTLLLQKPRSYNRWT